MSRNEDLVRFGIFLVSAFISFLFICLVIKSVKVAVFNIRCDKLDEAELHYDANGPFILIDERMGILGVYDADKPLYHEKFRFINRLDTDILTTVEDCYSDGVVLSDSTIQILKDHNFDKSIPILAVRRSYER